jgi:hypothetical protein
MKNTSKQFAIVTPHAIKPTCIKPSGATGPIFKENPMKHHKYNQHYQVPAAKLNARAEAALDLITALVIGIGMAALLVAWWSS